MQSSQERGKDIIHIYIKCMIHTKNNIIIIIIIIGEIPAPDQKVDGLPMLACAFCTIFCTISLSLSLTLRAAAAMGKNILADNVTLCVPAETTFFL